MGKDMNRKFILNSQNSNAYAYMHICTCVHTHKYTAYFIMPTWPVQIFGYKYIQEKVNGKKKKKKPKQSPIEENRSKKRFTERTSRETQETPHCPREYTFSEQLKRLQRNI